MTILALEFSSEVRSVALWRDGGVLARVSELGGRSTPAFALIQRVLAEAAVGREAVEVIAVGLGPGSYAGIRVAIAIAQGWALARGVRLLGVSSAEALAEQARAAGVRGRVHVVIDAQRGEVCHGEFDLDEDALRIRVPLRLATLDDVSLVAGQLPVLGWDAMASGLPGWQRMAPDAVALARRAALCSDFVSGDRLEPIYLRGTSFVKAPPARVIASEPT